jgi:hypothetical protein
MSLPLQQADRRAAPYVVAAAVFFFFFPGGIVLHEAGHYLAARALGREARLAYSRVTFGGESLTPGQLVKFKAAGPAVELVLATCGIIALTRRDWGRAGGLGYWLATACSLMALRWVKVAIEGPGSDEADISELLGMYWLALPAILVVPAAAVLAATAAVHSKQRTLKPLAVGFLAGLIGVGIWMLALGPFLLPLPS